MKKPLSSRFIAVLMILLTLCLTACAGCGSTPADNVGSEEAPLVDNTGRVLSDFVLDITLDTEQHRLAVTQSTGYTNNTQTELNEIYFNLIPNAFRADGGGIVFGSITIGESNVQPEQVKETVYKLTLPEPLPAAKRVDIDMVYTVNIPNIKNRFGYQKDSYNLGNFIVTPAVYDEDGWAVEPYIDIGDAFYTDIANYEVRLNVPDGYTVAATGKEVESGLYRAQSVRDFAFCAGGSYKTMEETLDGVAITVCYADDIDMTARRTMETAKRSLRLCGNAFGKYPYETLSIVMGGLTGGVNGMEYPTLVMISPEIPVEDYIDMGFNVSDSSVCDCLMLPTDKSICHEIAHQWFYGIVGNDQIAEPWLDEGMCRFSEYLYQEEYLRVPSPEFAAEYGVYPATDMLEYYYYANLNVSGSDTGYAPDTVSLEQSLYYWSDDPMGYSDVYYKGASLIYEMQQQLGKDSFDPALKEYVRAFAYDIVTKEDFVEFWSKRGDFSRLFDMYFD